MNIKEVAVKNTIEPYERPFRPLTLLTRFLEGTDPKTIRELERKAK